jgi:hypothetical protein
MEATFQMKLHLRASKLLKAASARTSRIIAPTEKWISKKNYDSSQYYNLSKLLGNDVGKVDLSVVDAAPFQVKWVFRFFSFIHAYSEIT